MCQLRWYTKMDIWQEIEVRESNPTNKFYLNICLCNKLSAGRRV